MIKKNNGFIIVSLMVVMLFTPLLIARASDAIFDFAKQFKGNGTITVTYTTTDTSNNVYTTGYFTGTVDFDPSVGVYSLTSLGGNDIFITKFDSSGNFVFAKQFGRVGSDIGYGIITDSSGNVYTTGQFAGTVDFDPGAGISNLTSINSTSDVFVLKLDSSGNFVFVKQFGGTLISSGKSISVDSSGNIYTMGNLNGAIGGTVDFDPGVGVSTLTTASTNYNTFISKLDINGDFLFVKKFSGTSHIIGDIIYTDTSGNIYTTGRLGGTADLDPGAGTANLTTAGAYDTFISKLDTSGVFVWAKKIGGAGVDTVSSIKVDNSGNVYTTGNFAGNNVDYDPGVGTSYLNSAGLSDIFISKLDINGNFVWVKQFGGTGNDSANSISLDSSGNIYTTGYFNNTVDFDPNVGTSDLVSVGGNDIFVSELDPSGNFVFVKQFGGTGADSGSTITLDSGGNIYTTGSFSLVVDFDPSVSTFNLTSTGSNIFFSKLDSSGNFVFAKQLGESGVGSTSGAVITLDSTGNIYTIGNLTGTVDFDPGVGVYNLTSFGNTDVFISKLDSSGNFIFAKKFGGAGNESGISIFVDGNGNIYTTGSFTGTADFDPGVGVSNPTPVGAQDAFISKLDSSGNFIWVKGFGGTSSDSARSVSIDSVGNVYITGNFWGAVDFDPGAGSFPITSASGNDVFISKFDPSGNFVWVKTFVGGSISDSGISIHIDVNDNIYTSGVFNGTVDFDPGVGSYPLSTSSGGAVFISKLDSSGNFVWANSRNNTGYNLLLNGSTFDSSGNIYQTGYFTGNLIDFDPGAGSLILSSNGGNDAFVSKLDSSGNFVWTKSFGGTGADIGYSVSTDASGNVYTTGYFNGTVDFDPGAGIYNLTSAGGNEIFISKLDPLGNFVWAKRFGGALGDLGSSIITDNNGGVYTTGYFTTTVDFDPNTGTYNLASGGSTDVFISKLLQTGFIITPTTLTINETGTNIFTTVLTSPIISDVVISVTSSDTTQATVSAPTLTFTPSDWSTPQTVTVTGVNDNTISTDTATITLSVVDASSDDNYDILADQTVTVTLTDNDIAGITSGAGGLGISVKEKETGTISVVLNTQPASDVVLNITSSDILIGTVLLNTMTFTSSNWNTSQDITVTGVKSGNTNIIVSVDAALSDSEYSSVGDITEPVVVTNIPIKKTVAGTRLCTPTINTFCYKPILITTPVQPILLDKGNLCPRDQILTQNLHQGARNGKYNLYTKAIVFEVKILQAHMNRLGFESGPVDGILGPITDGAIKRTQKFLGITQDGYVGPITRGLINNSCE